MSETISGKITLPPILKTSKAGKLYSEFTICPKNNIPQIVMAFGTTAEKLSKEGEMGMKLIGIGNFKDKKFFLKEYSLEKDSITVSTSRRVVKPPPTEIEILMDKLGAAYVNKRVRALIRDVNSLVSKSFPIQGYKNLLAELRKKVKEKENEAL